MSITDWTIVPGSVAGKYQGTLDFADGGSFTNFSTIGEYLGFGTTNPYSNDPSGIRGSVDAQGATYPIEWMRYSMRTSEEQAIPTLVRLVSNDYHSISAQRSDDNGSNWTDVYTHSIGGIIATYFAGESFTISGVSYYGVSIFFPLGGGVIRQGLYIDTDAIVEAFGVMENAGAKSAAYGNASGAGGYGSGGSGVGTFDDSSDHIGVPNKPSMGVTDIGFVNVYNPDVGDLVDLGSDLFPDFQSISPYSPSGSTVVDAITDVAEGLANIASNIPNVIAMFSNRVLLDYIIDCHLIPVAPTVGADTAIKIGYRTMDQAAPKVTSDYVDFDCGTINIGEYYANFIDYAPFTQIKLFLPFVGFVAIEPEFVQSGALHVVYRFNIIDGSFIAYVLASSSKSQLSDTVIAQYGGNACVHIPITGPNYANMVSGVVNAGVGAMTSIASGNAAGLISSAMGAIQPGQLQASNGYNATTSFLSVRRPYIVISRSVSHFSEDYASEIGIPSNITTKFNRIRGYTESSSVVLDHISATDEEKRMIAEALASGVIF